MLRTICVAAIAALLGAPLGAQEQGAAKNADTNSTVKVLRSTNKAQTNEFVCAALEMKHVNPFDVINYFWAVTSREEGGCYSFVNPDNESGYVVVICPRYQLETMQKLAQELDRPKLTSKPGSVYIYYRMKNRNVADPGFLDVLSWKCAGRSGILAPDVETNSVLIWDAPVGGKCQQEGLLNELDKPLTQAEMAVKIYEIEVKNDGALGLDFEAWKNGPGQILGQYQATGARLSFKGMNGWHNNADGGGLYLDYPSAFFDFLVEKGKAHSLVDTKISAISNVPAMLSTGEQYVYYDVASTTVEGDANRTVTARLANPQLPFGLAASGLDFPTDGKAIVSGEKPAPYGVRTPFQHDDPQALRNYPYNLQDMRSFVKSVDTGVSLVVVPTVGEQTINMNLELKVVGVNGFDGQGTPLFNTRQMNNALAVADGQEAIFGGVTRERKIQTTNKVPFLGSLPVVGYVFGREVTTTQKTVVVASIRPCLVKNNDNVTEKDKALPKQVAGEEVVVLPKTQYCFEQSMEHLY